MPNFLEQISQASSRSPTIILFNLACHFKISLLLWKSIILKPKSCWDFIPVLLIFAPIWFLQILNFWWIGWLTLERKADCGEGGGDKEKLIPPVAQAAGKNMFMSQGTLQLSQESVTFSLWLCPRVAVRAETPSWRPASSSHLTFQVRCLCCSTLQSICVQLWFLTSAMGLHSITRSYCVLWEFFQ